MPNGENKYKCDCCKRFFKKSRHGYYKQYINNQDVILCEDCNKRWIERKPSFFRQLRFPLEVYQIVDTDCQCSDCIQWFNSEKYKVVSLDNKLFCHKCFKKKFIVKNKFRFNKLKADAC